MLTDLRELAAHAKAQPSALIGARAKQFCDRLQDHERRETRLLIQVLSTDRGGEG